MEMGIIETDRLLTPKERRVILAAIALSGALTLREFARRREDVSYSTLQRIVSRSAPPSSRYRELLVGLIEEQSLMWRLEGEGS